MIDILKSFSFDGHGINDAEGQRICKVSSCEPYIYPNGLPQRNAEFDRLSNLFAAAPELLDACRQYLSIYADTQTNPTASQEAEVINAMRAAISKAEGKTR